MNTHVKTALITGANKGIGFQTAKELGRLGIKVLIGARDTAKGKAAVEKLKLEGINADYLALDVNDSSSVEGAAQIIGSLPDGLDILVNNAGIMSTLDGVPSATDMSVVRETFETNFFGALLVTQKMLPAVKKAQAGRIVNVSSGLGSLALNQDPEWEYPDTKLIGYNASKAALNRLTVQLAWELQESNIKVNAVNPNFTNTELLPDTSGGRPVEEAVREIVRLALLPESGPTGGFFEDGEPLPW